jgi:hypothetical protein
MNWSSHSLMSIIKQLLSYDEIGIVNRILKSLLPENNRSNAPSEMSKIYSFNVA